MAADVAVALTSQIAAGLALYWSLGGGWARKIIWLGIIPLTMALNVAYLSVIPAFFLIEADTASEMNTWPSTASFERWNCGPYARPPYKQGKALARGGRLARQTDETRSSACRSA